MSGFYALNKNSIRTLAAVLSFGLSLACLSVHAQSAAAAAPKSQKATIQSEEAGIYQDSNFDSPMIGSVTQGAVYDISVGKRNGFYKIRLKPGTVGWIADSDIVGGVTSADRKATADLRAGKKPAKAAKKAKLLAPPKKKSRPFPTEAYRGAVLEFLPFQESTLGSKRKDNLMFYGFKVAGPNTLLDGDMTTDANLLFHYGAPSYYKDATGNDASGFIFLANFLFETTQSHGPNTMTFYGFGPMFRYSHFNVGLTTNGQNLNYSADDMTLGAVFNVGLSLRLNSGAVRLDAKYYWEKETYLGFGLSYLWKF